MLTCALSFEVLDTLRTYLEDMPAGRIDEVLSRRDACRNEVETMLDMLLVKLTTFKGEGRI